MFLIFGINQKEKLLNYTHSHQCGGCSSSAVPQILMRYTYFMLFFIPLIKWGKEYYIKFSCCNNSAVLPKGKGELAEKNIKLDLSDISWTKTDKKHYCFNCGFSTEENYSYCPICSQKLS